MQKIKLEDAARTLGVNVQALRVMIQNNVIKGATCYGPKHRRTYYITDVHVDNFMKGVTNEQE